LEQMERKLAGFKATPGAISKGDRAAILPPGVPNYIKRHLLDLDLAPFIHVLEQTCERARKRRRAEVENRKYLDYLCNFRVGNT
jgi:hypothetical protein